LLVHWYGTECGSTSGRDVPAPPSSAASESARAALEQFLARALTARPVVDGHYFPF
jgi:hypothetical protein